MESESCQQTSAQRLEVFQDGELLSSKGSRVSARDALKGKYVGVYFSASWCPPCKRFTPKLVEAYTNHLKGKNLEIVFVSAGFAPYSQASTVCLLYWFIVTHFPVRPFC